MKLHLLSDLHLEFADIDLPGGDVLLLAGDICVADHLRENRTDRTAIRHCESVNKFFTAACEKYSKVYYIAGNHEHYSGVFENTNSILRDWFKRSNFNVTLLEDEVVPLNDEYMLYGATLWTDLNKMDYFAEHAAKTYMNDFRLIKSRGNSITTTQVEEINHQTRVSLKTYVELLSPDKKFIVMTHHSPSMKSVHPKFGTDALNYAFSNTGLEDFILDNPNIKYWVHGHTHDSHDYMIGECRVVCNPRGYARHGAVLGENKEFNIDLTLEI
jgi:DNA repair exonuclease SbcCD nuclease subunit